MRRPLSSLVMFSLYFLLIQKFWVFVHFPFLINARDRQTNRRRERRGERETEQKKEREKKRDRAKKKREKARDRAREREGAHPQSNKCYMRHKRTYKVKRRNLRFSFLRKAADGICNLGTGSHLNFFKCLIQLTYDKEYIMGPPQ